MERWLGKVALVTGASSGIGAAVAKALVEHGLTVVGVARNTDKLQDLSTSLKDKKGKLATLRCDVSKEAEVLSVFEYIKKTYGKLHVCVNNAGISRKCPILSGKTEDFQATMDINVIGVCVCTREAFQLMKASGVDDGHIINISSLMGHEMKSNKNGHMYGASKHAVRAITEGIRNELRELKSNIRVTQISPALVETEFFSKREGEERAQQVFAAAKYLEAKDISDALVYALSAPSHVQVHDIIMRSTDQV